MFSRRRLLDAAAGLGAFAWLSAVAGALLRGRAARAAADPRSFPAYLETLIPEEPDAPGALRLGIPDRLVAAADADYAETIDAFCRWLDERANATAGRPFADLAEEARDALVGAAESAAPDSLPARAFRRTRHDAFALYYGDSRSWPAVGYRGPPQPEGFPDYAQPPQDGR